MVGVLKGEELKERKKAVDKWVNRNENLKTMKREEKKK